jgi:tetratricopeptide (TPR) repeat protein
MGIRDLFRQNKDEIYDKGIYAFKAGNFPMAIEHFSKVIKLDPSDAPAHYNLAYSYIATDNYGEAINHFEEYMRLVPDKADEDLHEYVDVVKQAASLDIDKARQVLRDYVRKENEAYKEVTVAGKTILYVDFLEKVGFLIHTEGFLKRPLVEEFFNIIRDKVVFLIFGTKGLKNIDTKDAFGFGIAFTLTGYAIARVSKDYLGHSAYIRSLPSNVVQDIGSRTMPYNYDIDLLKIANPIHWKFINRVIKTFSEGALSRFLETCPWARSGSESIRDYIIKEFILFGYYVGLWENAGGRHQKIFA